MARSGRRAVLLCMYDISEAPLSRFSKSVWIQRSEAQTYNRSQLRFVYVDAEENHANLYLLKRLVADYLAAIIGLAVSNEMVENANFTAHHLLRTCKSYMSLTICYRSNLCQVDIASVIHFNARMPCGFLNVFTSSWAGALLIRWPFSRLNGEILIMAEIVTTALSPALRCKVCFQSTP